jgi:hypothetical protein
MEKKGQTPGTLLQESPSIGGMELAIFPYKKHRTVEKADMVSSLWSVLILCPI